MTQPRSQPEPAGRLIDLPSSNYASVVGSFTLASLRPSARPALPPSVSVRRELIPGSAFCHFVGGGGGDGGGGEVGSSRPEIVRVLDRPPGGLQSSSAALTWELLARFAALPGAAPARTLAGGSFASFWRPRSRRRSRRRPPGLANGHKSTQKLRVAARDASSSSPIRTCSSHSRRSLFGRLLTKQAMNIAHVVLRER